MILAQWRARRANRSLIDQLHGKIVAASRRPALYLELEVPDHFEGRFEMVTLFAGLVIRRLTAIPGMGAELAQALGDGVFRHFEDALREIGVGDVAVPKRLKRMAEAFYGRIKAYSEGLAESDDALLAAALARNVYGEADVARAPSAPRLAHITRVTAAALEEIPFETFARGEVAFPDLAGVLAHSEADNG